MEKNRKCKKEFSFSGIRIGYIDQKSNSWMGMFQVINHDGTRKYIDQNKDGQGHGPLVWFIY